MTPELRHLRYLISVAEHGNFSRAAEDLHLSQPTLSQQIKQLERMVGRPLLDRGGRTVRLTDAGAAYVRHARRALREVAAAEQAVHDVADLTRGYLRLAVTPTFTAYLIGPLVAELNARHPGITVELTETTQDKVETGLLADEFDLGIAFAQQHLPGVEATAIYAETLGLVAAPSDTPRPPLWVDELGGLDLALLSGGFLTRRHIDSYLRGHGVEPRIVVQANSIQAVIEVVRHTGLVTVLPDAVTDDHPELTRIPIHPPLPARTVAILRRTAAHRSAASEAFTAVALEWVGARGYLPPTDHRPQAD
ncbi:transcriptional regulator CynR [Nocardia sp. NPDC059180]|uniref:transcriptional regulator CynR n=1 Tax=Nocardia sp. NPDC059180 TaxID=3346761 RepID=UPI0036B6AB08